VFAAIVGIYFIHPMVSPVSVLPPSVHPTNSSRRARRQPQIVSVLFSPSVLRLRMRSCKPLAQLTARALTVLCVHQEEQNNPLAARLRIRFAWAVPSVVQPSLYHRHAQAAWIQSAQIASFATLELIFQRPALALQMAFAIR
jgi:hypothetical protein